MKSRNFKEIGIGAFVMAAFILPAAITLGQSTEKPKRGDRELSERGNQDGERGNRPQRGPGPGGPGGPGGEMGPMMRVMRDLNLSEEQREQIHTIVQAQRDQHEKAMEAHRSEIDDIDKQIRALVEKKKAILGMNPEDTITKVKAILTDEQKTQLETKIAEFRERGPRPGGPGFDGEGGDSQDRPMRRGQMRKGGGDGNGKGMPDDKPEF